MCWIAWIFFSQQKKTEQGSQVITIKKILQHISHRGEKKLRWHTKTIDNHTTLWINRLAIVNKEWSEQPLSDSSWRYHIVMNGELYNFRELKTQLEQLWHTFTTEWDTEVFLHTYIQRKESPQQLFSQIDGMFAAIIYDAHENTIRAARDHMGIKPLYYSYINSWIYFCSEIKWLANLPDVKEINTIQSWHRFDGQQQQKHTHLLLWNKKPNKQTAATTIKKLLEQSVCTRVDTSLSIGVYFSWWIDSSTILHFATKYHNDVTAIIAGNSTSSDRRIAQRYCKEYDIPYILITPPSEKELFLLIPQLVQITESREPNMIRQAALSYYIAQAAAQQWLKVILCGEWADELFFWYPEFTQIKKPFRTKLWKQFQQDLHQTQLQRVDRTSMHFTTEVRVPFLSRKLVEYVNSLNHSYKIHETNRQIITKYILRETMKDELPDYITYREKIVLSEWAWYKGNQKEWWLFSEHIGQNISDIDYQNICKQYQNIPISTKEEAYYFSLYASYWYTKYSFSWVRSRSNAESSISE